MEAREHSITKLRVPLILGYHCARRLANIVEDDYNIQGELAGRPDDRLGRWQSTIPLRLQGLATDLHLLVDQFCHFEYPSRQALYKIMKHNIFLRTTQHALDDFNGFPAHHLQLQLSPSANALANANGLSTRGVDKEVALTIRLVPGTAAKAGLQPYSPILDIYYTPN